MPKRGRDSVQEVSHDSPVENEDTYDLGHTPKWTRSSSSPSPEPQSSTRSSISRVQESETNHQEMRCLLPGHGFLTLASLAEYEAHIIKEHSNQCVECDANLPSPWLLELHQKEQHDPMVAARRDNGDKVYECFLQDCEKITSTPQKRRLHLIDKHGYPRDYDFRIVETGTAGRKSLLLEGRASNAVSRRRRVSDVGKPGWREISSKDLVNSPSSSMTTIADKAEDGPKYDSGQEKNTLSLKQRPTAEKPPNQDANADAIDSISSAMSALTFFPRSVKIKSKGKTKNNP